MLWSHRAFGRALTILWALGLSVTASAQFETRATISLPILMWSVAVGDFNQDGKLDIAVGCDQRVQIFLGNGDGTFLTSVSYAYGDNAYSIATADLNHDGKLDLVVASGDTVSVQLGNGDGTFQPAVSYDLRGKAEFVGVADVNGDHVPDLIASEASIVSVLLGNGDGTFRIPVDTDVTSATSVGWGDFDGDGTLDLAIAQQEGFVQGLAIYFGNGDGTFHEGETYATQGPPESIAVGDFNGDGKPDLAVALEFGPIGIFLGTGEGTFETPVYYPALFPHRLIVADLDGDGIADLAASNLLLDSRSVVGGVSVLMGNGDGTFRPQTTYTTVNSAWTLAAADFNRDHQTDIVNVGDEGDIMTLLNTGTANFSPTTALTFPPQFLNKVSPQLTTTLTNTDPSPLKISSISVASPFRLSKLSTCGASVASGANCKISVTFKPTSTGLFTGAVTIMDSASSKPQIVELVGSGTVMTVSPEQLNFAPQKVGTKSPAQTVTITNRGKTTVDVNSILETGGLNDDFPYVNHCGSQISAGASCTVDVSFEPFGKGKQGGLLNVSIANMGNPLLVYLRGTGE